MSVNEEVLDNWEEIDEVGLTSKLNKLRNEQTSRKKNTTENNVMPHENGINLMMIDNEFKPKLLQRDKPSVTILKRPTSGANSNSSENSKPKPPIKTLQQREQEYAEARLRILGSAQSPDDHEVDNSDIIDDIDYSLDNINFNNSSVLIPQLQQLHLQQINLKPNENENIIRYPRGPDGTTGFHFKR